MKKTIFKYKIGSVSQFEVYEKDIKDTLSFMSINALYRENAISIYKYIFTEMFGNAFDHSGGTEVVVSLRVSKNYVDTTIQDNGIGIFEKFKSTLTNKNLIDAPEKIIEGGLTTGDTEIHSGFGVCALAGMVDKFRIEANGLFLKGSTIPKEVHSFGTIKCKSKEIQGLGTRVWFRVSEATAKRIYQMNRPTEKQTYSKKKSNKVKRLIVAGTLIAIMLTPTLAACDFFGNGGDPYPPNGGIITPAQYIVTFNTNGGNFINSISQNAGTQITRSQAPDPTKDGGYIFAGWYTNQALTTPAAFPMTLNNNITLFARWNPPQTTTPNVDFEAWGFGASDGYVNYETVGVAPTRDARIYFEANKKPTSAEVEINGNKTPFVASQIGTNNGKFYVDISGKVAGIHGSTLVANVSVQTTGNATLGINAGSVSQAVNVQTPAVAKPTPAGLPAFTNHSMETNLLKLNLSDSIARARAQHAMLTVNYERINRATGAVTTQNFTGSVTDWLMQEHGYTLETLPSKISFVPIRAEETSNIRNITASLSAANGQTYLIGQGSKIVAPDIQHGNYRQIVEAVEARITQQLKQLGGSDFVNSVRAIVGTDGVVRVQWNVNLGGGYNADAYFETTIPGVNQNSTLEQWVAAVANMPVNVDLQGGNPNFNVGGSLPLSDAQILFEHALNQRGNAADQTLLAGAEVVMVRSIQSGPQEHLLTMLLKASDGSIYVRNALFQNNAEIMQLAASGSKNALSWGGQTFTPVSALFPEATQGDSTVTAAGSWYATAAATAAVKSGKAMPNAAPMQNAELNTARNRQAPHPLSEKHPH